MDFSDEKKLDEVVDKLYKDYSSLNPKEAIKAVRSLNVEHLSGLETIKTIDDLKKLLWENKYVKYLKALVLHRLSNYAFPNSEDVAIEYLSTWEEIVQNYMLSNEDARDLIMITIDKYSSYCFDYFPNSLNIAIMFSTFLTLVYRSNTYSSVLDTVNQCISRIYNSEFSSDENISKAYNEIVNGIISNDESEENNKERIIVFSETASINIHHLYHIIEKLDSPNIKKTSDPDFVVILEDLKEHFDYLILNNDNIQLIQLFSNKRSVYTVSCDSLYGIVWDEGYWSFFQSFISVILGTRKDDDLSSILNEPAGTNLSLLELTKKTLGHLDNLLLTVNPQERISLKYFESNILKIHGLNEINLKINIDSIDNSNLYLFFGKMHVMFHEVEHILNALERRTINSVFNFDNMLKIHQKLLYDFGDEKSVNGISKAEQIECIDKLISQEGKWKRIYTELGTDYNALINSIFTLNKIYSVPLPNIIFWCICGSKLISMFHTYRNIIDFYVSLVLELKGKGIVDIEKANEEIRKNGTDMENEIEFRDVLFSHLQQHLLYIFRNEEIISSEEFDSIISQRDKIIDAYNCFFPEYIEIFQKLALCTLLTKEETMEIVIEIPINDDYTTPQIPNCLKNTYTVINSSGFDGDSVFLFFDHLETILSIASNITAIATFIISMIAMHKSKVRVSGKPIPATASQKDVEDILSKTLAPNKSNSNKSATNKKRSKNKRNPEDKTPTIKPGKLFLEVDGMQIEVSEIKKKAKKLVGDVYVVTKEKKIYDTNGKSLDLF